MKDALKALGILAMGLFVAIIVYPFLHEAGHTIATVLAGAKVIEFNLWPIPSILCNAIGISTGGFVIIGFSGTIFPILISLILPRKRFYMWYLKALLQGISLLALCVSFVSVMFRVNLQDDMFQVLKFWSYGEASLLLLLSGGMAFLLSLILREKPSRRICNFFDM